MPTTTTADPTQQPLDTTNIKILVPKVQISPYGSTAVWNEDDGWLDLGLLDADTLKFDFPQDKHDVMAGSPQYVAARFKTGMNGKCDFTLAEMSVRARQLALGHNIDETATLVATSSGTVAAGATVNGFTYAAVIPVTLPTPGQVVKIICTDAVLTTRVVYGRVRSCSVGGVVVFENPIELAPTAGDVVATIDYTMSVIGGSFFRNWRARILLSATDNSLHVVELLKVNVTTGFQIQASETKHAMLPVSLECLGQTQTIDSRRQLVLAKYYDKPSMVL